MRTQRRYIAGIALIMAAVIGGCANDEGSVTSEIPETETVTGEQDEITTSEAETSVEKEPEEADSLTEEADANVREPDGATMELVRDMGIGINLGNTFESCGDWIAQWGDGSVQSYETAWGSPMITQEIIQGYADAGFGVLRIPVAWSNLMGEDYTISGEYLAAVTEVVDWTQVSEAFQDYGDHLVFESMNEEGCWDSVWNQYSGSKVGKEEVFSLLNEINQTFVDIVRSSGGNNPERHLLIAGYATNIEWTSDELYHMPVDPAGRCAVSVHYYTPSVFAILEEDANWGKCRSTWGTEADFKELQKYMDMIKTNFIDQGIPVILGEYGCPKNNKEEESVRLFLTSVCKEAYERQICPILWDITDLHYDRSTCKMKDALLLEGLMENLISNDSF